MFIKFNIVYTLVSLFSILLGIFTLTGHTQQIVKFSTPLNEMAFCVVFLMVGILSLSAAFEIRKTK